MKKFTLLGVISLFATINLFAQNWQSISEAELINQSSEEPQIRASEAHYYELNYDEFYSELLAADNGTLISIPTAKGSFIQLRLEENQLLPQGLRANFPGIRTFNALPVEDGNTWGKLEISHKGFRAMIFSPGEFTLFVDPVFKNSTDSYIVYTRDKFTPDESFDCAVSSNEPVNREGTAKAGEPYNNCELKTYRLAIAATGEYTIYHGGTVEDALAAMATTMDRVSGVYERDFGVTFTLIENIDEIVYTDPDNDPYTNGQTFSMINENQANINSVIGADNYDVGHVFGTNSGGLAGLGVICVNNQKARGVTGSANPVNDPFDIDYVAHELGHQFGANHTQNNDCNSVPGVSVEPGSASTIMGYAGICAPNIQNNSDDHFHGINMEEIGFEIEANGCQVTTEIPNTAPIIQELPEIIFIPVSTPFSLAADATDLDGDTLTYCWEQMDPEESQQPPVATSTAGPNFRSLSPSEDSVRYFPSLASLVTNGPFTWEVVPSVERQMSFRLSVRDNSPGAGCTQYEDVEVQTVGTAGPFEVLYPSDNGIVWQAFSQETILWDVANTTADPINAETVNIWLSTNNGFAFQILLAEDVPNTGSHTIQVPNVQTGIAKVMIQNSAGTFFDVSDNNFDIVTIENGFYFETEFQGAEICQGETFSFDVNLVEVGEYPETIDLSFSDQPVNSDISLSVDQAQAGDAVTITANDLSSTPAGVYTLTLTGAGGDFENEIEFPITVLNASPSPSQPEIPTDGAEAVPTNVLLQWEDTDEPGITYSVEVASDTDFSTIVASATDIEENNLDVSGLDPETEYFWRVSNQNICGSSEFSEIYSFTTFTCSNESPEDTPVAIPENDPGVFTSELVVDQAALIADIDVLGVEGEHTAVSDLIFTLESPDGTQAILASTLCGLNITLQENGDVFVNSPAAISGTYQSSGAADWSGAIPFSGISARGVIAIDSGGDGDESDMCEPAVNVEELEGNIALINRGSCTFVQKVLFAQQAGAAAVIIINNIPGDGFFDMGGNSDAVDIPAVMVSYEDGQTLLSGIGGDAQDFFISFDDDAPEGSIACPPTDGGTYQPQEALSVFEGMNAQGTWKLRIEDTQEGAGGQLINWSLNICFTDDDISSTHDNQASQVRIFPNPTSGILTVDLADYAAERALLIDLSGRVLENRLIQNTRLDFNLDRYSDGFYFIRLEGDGSNAVFKVIKQD
jgi:subtilisin-like proprotein convertase family protein